MKRYMLRLSELTSILIKKTKGFVQRVFPYRFFDIIIIIILFVAIYAISIIGLDIDCLKKEVSMTTELINNLNSVLLNLSYSYAVGVFVYILTAMRPYYRRRKQFADLIHYFTLRYKEYLMISYLYSFYPHEMFEKNEDNIVFQFYKNLSEETKVAIRSVSQNESKAIFKERLTYSARYSAELANMILVHSDFLPDVILGYVMKINKCETEENLDVLLFAISNRNGDTKLIESDFIKIHDLLKEEIILLNDLERDIKKYI